MLLDLIILEHENPYVWFFASGSEHMQINIAHVARP